MNTSSIRTSLHYCCTADSGVDFSRSRRLILRQLCSMTLFDCPSVSHLGACGFKSPGLVPLMLSHIHSRGVVSRICESSYDEANNWHEIPSCQVATSSASCTRLLLCISLTLIQSRSIWTPCWFQSMSWHRASVPQRQDQSQSPTRQVAIKAWFEFLSSTITRLATIKTIATLQYRCLFPCPS